MSADGSDRCGNGHPGPGNRFISGLLRCLSQRTPAGKPDSGPARLFWRAYLSAHRQRWRVSYRLDQQRTAARRQIVKAVASSQLPVAVTYPAWQAAGFGSSDSNPIQKPDSCQWMPTLEVAAAQIKIMKRR